MEESKFQEYYKQIRERDERIANEQPLPKVEGVNVWTIFGLSLGIAAIVLGFFSKYTIVLAIVALVFSLIGYKQKNNNVVLAAIICSSLGLILSIVCAIYRYMYMSTIKETWQSIIGLVCKL